MNKYSKNLKLKIFNFKGSNIYTLAKPLTRAISPENNAQGVILIFNESNFHLNFGLASAIVKDGQNISLRAYCRTYGALRKLEIVTVC